MFCTVQQAPAGVEPMATVREDEGLTVVVEKDVADGAGFEYDFVAAMITLGVGSRLDAVGLTPVVHPLAEAGISCNVMAGYFHDHLFVPVDRAEERSNCSTRSLAEPLDPRVRPASSPQPARVPPHSDPQVSRVVEGRRLRIGGRGG